MPRKNAQKPAIMPAQIPKVADAKQPGTSMLTGTSAQSPPAISCLIVPEAAQAVDLPARKLIACLFPLPLFVLGVLRAGDEDPSFPHHWLASVAEAFDRGAGFHAPDL